MDSKVQASAAIDDLGLDDLLRILWQRRLIIFCAVLAGAGIAIGAAFWATPKYTATIIVSPVSNTPGSGALSGLGAIASEFGGLASLAGISVGGDSRKAETIAVLQSESLTERFIATNDLLPILYHTRWNAKARIWKTTDPRKVPTLWKANQLFKNLRAISTDARSGLVTMTITWTDPKAAAAWANGLVKMTNDYLRQQAITESDRNIAYLKEQATRTDMVGVQQAIYAVMQNEINKEMLARGTNEYALKIVDPAQAPERPSSPRFILWALLGVAGGFMLSAAAVLARIG